MSTYLYIFVSVGVISLIALVGIVFLALSPKTLKKLTLFLVSFSAGTLIGDAFLHLLPESIEASANQMDTWVGLIIGILLFFVLEKIIHWRHCHVNTSPEHPHHLGVMNLIGDSFHNFFDGLIIAGSFLVNIPLGIATSIAVIAHEIPQEIADFGVLIYAGYSKKKAIFLNFITALTAMIGAAVAILFTNSIEGFSQYIVPITAGGFIYIAVADFIPELKKERAPLKSLYQLVTIIIGIAFMFILKILFE